MPLDFLYEKGTNEYMLDEKYDSDQKLLEKVQTGRGDLAIYEVNQSFLYIEGMFADTEPKLIEQQMYPNSARPDLTVGTNDLMKAKVAQYSYYIDHARNKDIDDEAYLGFEQNLHQAVEEWSKTTKAAKFILYTE